MDEKTAQTLQDIKTFLEDHKDCSDGREVRCITPFSEDVSQLNLGDIRRLAALIRSYGWTC